MNYNSYDNYSGGGYGDKGGAGGGGGGGFMAGGGSQQSPSTNKPKDDTLRPVTIKQLNDAINNEADFTVDGSLIHQITIVAQVRNISIQTTNVTYRLDDGTGVIEAKQWVDPDTPDDGSKYKLHENGYVRVWGRMKAFGNKRHLSAHFIRPISDFNEISYHLLEATVVHLHFTQGSPGSKSGGNNNANGQRDTNMGNYTDNNDNSNFGGNNEVTLPSMASPGARKVFECLRTVPQSHEGLHMEDIAARLRMSSADVAKAGDELLGFGVIFTTVDDNTWAILAMGG